jgi:glycosyltransferase involved in cell wall biosynthesis
MRMWLDAIQSLGADLEILFFRDTGEAGDAATAAEVAQQLHEAWGIRSRVVLSEREDLPHRPGRLAGYIDAYLKPAFGPSQHPHFRAFREARQREAFAGCLARSPDLVFFQRTYVTAPAIGVSLGGARILFDIDDIEHRRFAREVAQPPRWRLKPLLYLQVPALWWGERQAIARADCAFVCSEIDRRYLWRAMRVRNLEVIPNAVGHVEERPLPAEPTVLFLGAYSYPPNAVAADYLIREVWPRLVRTCPRARLLIAGPNSEVLASFRHPPAGVEFLGFVPDLDALYRGTRIVCCPIQAGTGTRFKILEAASYGVPVVSTGVGAEGIDFAADREIMIRDSAPALAEASATLLADDGLARRIGAAGRARVRALYSRDAIVERMVAILGQTAGTGPGERYRMRDATPGQSS